MIEQDALAATLRDLAASSHAMLCAGYELGVVDRQLVGHPARARFQALLEKDELAALFPAGDAGYLFLSTGEGQHITRDGLPATIVAGAGNQLRALYDTFSADELVDESQRLLHRIRRLVGGDEVEFPALSMFAGVGIAPAGNVELPWGLLAPPTQWANTWAEWSRADLMLVTYPPIRAAIAQPGPDPSPPADFTAMTGRTNDRLDSLERCTSLTLLLGLNGKSGAIRQWRVVMGPLFGQGFSTRGGNPRALFGTQAHIDTTAATSLMRWGRLVEERYERRLDIATDRLISSVAVRHDPGDALVDAVIALEAMFAGADQGELSFRIAAALASLLEPVDPTARESVFREMGQIYSARSKIVHGHSPPTADSRGLRDRAFELGRRALARLYEHHPGLLGDDARSRRLILRLDSS